MVTSRTQVLAPLVVLLLTTGTVAAHAQSAPAPNDAAKASFWATPPPKAAATGWGKPTTAAPVEAKVAPVAPPVPARSPAVSKVATGGSVVAAPRRATARRPPRPRISLAWDDTAVSVTPSLVASSAPLTATAAERPSSAPTDVPATAPSTAAPATTVVEEGVVTTAPEKADAGTPQQVVTPRDPPKPSVPKAAAAAPNGFPSWVTFSVINRGRVEGTRAIAVRGSENDQYYLNRLRLRALFSVSPYLEVFGEGQDSRVADYDGVGVPRNMRNVFDLRQAYLDLHARNGKAWRLRVGRQELALGDGRLIASPDWGNINRTYDMVRGSAAVGRVRVDAFGGLAVQAEPDLFDRRKKGEYFYGLWTVVDKVAPNTAIEPFVVVKHNDNVIGEDLVLGNADVVTVGLRATSKVWRRLDTATDIVVQQGSFANDDIRSWAFHQQAAVPFAKQPWKPRLVVDYAVASGDDDPKDGRRQTFDQLYSSNHGRYGLADQVGWRNMHDVGVTLEATPHKALKIGVGAHKFLLFTVNDGFYGSGGSRVVLNRKATSRDLGVEVDGWFQWTISKELSLSGGLGTLFAGDYLKQSTDGRTLMAPYLLWNVKF